MLVCKHCGANYTGVNKNGLRYYVCGSYVYRKGADCDAPSWYIPRETIETHVVNVLLDKIPSSNSAIRQWVDEMNRSVAEHYGMIDSTREAREGDIEALEMKMQRLVEMVAQTGPVPELAEEIAAVSAALRRLEAINATQRPARIEPTELIELRKRLADASDPEAITLRQGLFKSLVTRITADAKNHTREGDLLDPRANIGMQGIGGAKGR